MDEFSALSLSRSTFDLVDALCFDAHCFGWHLIDTADWWWRSDLVSFSLLFDCVLDERGHTICDLWYI